MNGEEQVVTGELADQIQSDDKPEVDVEVLAKAKRMGWTDQNEFKGHPDRWVDAETYVNRADEHLPILKGTVATMNKTMVAQEKLILEQEKRLKAMQADIQEFVGYTRKAEERAYQKALAEMKAEQRQAVEDQDLDKFDRISSEIDSHLKSHPVAKPDPEAELESVEAKAAQEQYATPEVYNTWLVDNQWYKEKPKMADYALRMDRWLSDTKPSQIQRERLAEITKLVKDEFPEYWSNPKRVSAQTVESGDGTGSAVQKGKRLYANLPPEAKTACDRFSGADGKGVSGNIKGYTREDYLKDYPWSD